VLIESVEYDDRRAVSNVLEESVFRYCEFSKFSYEGGHIDAVFLSCTFRDIEWYWGLFNACVFVGTRFVGCTFRGTSFPDCRFVECEFVECRFVADNLARECSAEGARVYGSSATSCTGAEFLFGDGAP